MLSACAQLGARLCARPAVHAPLNVLARQNSSYKNRVVPGVMHELFEEPPEKKRERDLQELKVTLAAMFPVTHKIADPLPERITTEFVEQAAKQYAGVGVSKKQVHQLCQVYLSSKLHTMTGTQLADVSWVFFQLGIEAEAFQGLILKHALARKSEMSPQDLDKICWGFTHRNSVRLALMRPAILSPRAYM
eukprot:comp48721_c0_seq1/m.47620 comp48721_c0_seq1/g.47620  ORF comp48721_c0_seq1/g.47620 comp48721_c0_seq1/m.47620 type:complete len:191 (-) comp48721_c0_seq1:521-1093(-)